MLDAVELLRRRAAHHAVDVVALVEQQLGQVGAILTGHAGDQGRATVAHARVGVAADWSMRPAAYRGAPTASSVRPASAPPARRSRSHATVAAIPSSTSIRAFQRS